MKVRYFPETDFVFSVLHPGFETPLRVPESAVAQDAAGNFVAGRVIRYEPVLIVSARRL